MIGDCLFLRTKVKIPLIFICLYFTNKNLKNKFLHFSSQRFLLKIIKNICTLAFYNSPKSCFGQYLGAYIRPDIRAAGPQMDA